MRECIRDAKRRTNTTRGGRGARHPKTTLPHRLPGTPAAVVLLGGGAPAGTRPLRGWLNPPGPIFWSGPIRGPDGCPSHPPP
eukprot:scaffold39874_cov66-Phaeocystis_antarctica.AAC.3